MKRTPFTITDSMELVCLRVSIGQLCSALGVETKELPVVGKSMEDLAVLAKHNERGWNTLAETARAKVEQLKIAGDVMATQLEIVAADLAAVVPQTDAWINIINGTKRQSEYGRKFFPKVPR